MNITPNKEAIAAIGTGEIELVNPRQEVELGMRTFEGAPFNFYLATEWSLQNVAGSEEPPRYELVFTVEIAAH